MTYDMGLRGMTSPPVSLNVALLQEYACSYVLFSIVSQKRELPELSFTPAESVRV